MSTPDLLVTEPAGEPAGTLLLAHGAGAPMDSATLEAAAAALAGQGVHVVRFEFPYMAARRTGSRRPPPKAETLVDDYRAAVDATLARFGGPLLIGGKSLGGRVSVLAAGTVLDSRVLGVVVYGYPFHPPGKPEATRLAPLSDCRLPVTILQGSRDPFGTAEDVAAYPLPATVTVRWFEDGDHDLKPRKASGRTLSGHLETAAAVVRRLFA
ncbi:alpha/beta family hydrolase [Chthonobacter albigriseus]|uniref:alpha/beta family hydrolase n=1 Tax=Chthonobacter albigriseus TaxID=1683161 RepID=UPI0015EE7A27|nr:alpha/beta family hydrolase [Chthonobacter albigriseus]